MVEPVVPPAAAARRGSQVLSQYGDAVAADMKAASAVGASARSENAAEGQRPVDIGDLGWMPMRVPGAIGRAVLFSAMGLLFG
jgi:hypothetical protein